MYLPVLALRLASSAAPVRSMTMSLLLGSRFPAETRKTQLETCSARMPMQVVYQIMCCDASVYRTRTRYMKGMSCAMETSKAAQANRKGVYPRAKAPGLYALDQ